MQEKDSSLQTISIEGKRYTSDFFRAEQPCGFALQSGFHRRLFFFLQDWFSELPWVEVQTSGSTGTPKKIRVEKQRMMESARLTCSFLNLQPGNTALLCMPLDYIAGKMMVVRAWVAGLDLYPVEPTSDPLKNSSVLFDFAAMVPLQVYQCLQSAMAKERLKSIRKLIIGGAALDPGMEETLREFPHHVYSTYGMTETLSHIALRKLNGREASERYIPFPSVTLSLSEENTLIIDAPRVASERLYTNDIAELYEDGSFCILGRKDNIINTGGVKVPAEQIEKLLKPLIQGSFAVTSLPDPKFGEIIVLVTEGEMNGTSFEDLPPYYRPKKIIQMKHIPLTETGKINRKRLKEMMLSRD